MKTARTAAFLHSGTSDRLGYTEAVSFGMVTQIASAPPVPSRLRIFSTGFDSREDWYD